MHPHKPRQGKPLDLRSNSDDCPPTGGGSPPGAAPRTARTPKEQSRSEQAAPLSLSSSAKRATLPDSDVRLGSFTHRSSVLAHTPDSEQKPNNGATVEKWPARSPSLSWTNEVVRRSVTGVSDFMSLARAPPKPPLLHAIENFLARELAALTPFELANGGRLRVYREVMRMLAENFKTYGLIISAAMSEYDRELNRMRDVEVKKLTYETTLKAITEESNEKIGELHLHYTSQLRSNDEEKRAFDAAIREAQERRHEADTILLEVLDDVGALKEEREQDLGKMLALVRAVKTADSRLKAYQDKIKQLTAELEKMEDLKACLAESEARLRETTELYQDFIPRKHYLAMKQQLESKIQELTELEKQSRRLATHRSAQLDRSTRVARQLTIERDAIRNRGAVTPRPQLDAVAREEIDALAPPIDNTPALTTAALLEQCVHRLRLDAVELAELRKENAELKDRADATHGIGASASSRQSTQAVVLCRLQSHASIMRMVKKLRDTPDACFPQPTAPSPDNIVPSYWRFIGTVPRAELPRREIAFAINLFWEFRKQDRGTEPNIHVSLHKFFVNRFGGKLAPGKAVNFLESCVRFRYADSRCELLLGILDGYYPERLQCDVIEQLDVLRTEIRALSGPEKTKRIRKGLFMDAVGKHIDYKPPSFKESLRLSLGRDTSLDIEDMCNPAHPFMDLICVQGCEERMDLYTRLVEAFTLAATPDGMITHDEVENCICNVDPLTSRTTVIELCRPEDTVAEQHSVAPSTAASPLLSSTQQPGDGDEHVSRGLWYLPLSLLLERLAKTSIARVAPA